MNEQKKSEIGLIEAQETVKPWDMRNWIEDDTWAIDLPLDFGRKKGQTCRGAKLFTKVDGELCKKIRLFASAGNATEYMILQSAVFILLSKYSRQDCIVIGSSMDGSAVIDSAMRAMPEGKKLYCDFLQEMHGNCLKIHESMLCQLSTVITFRRSKQSINSFSEVASQACDSQKSVAEFDLKFDFDICSDGYIFELKYNADLFARENIAYMQEHYISILQQIMENPGARLLEFQAVTVQEKSLILGSFNNTAREYPREKTIAQLFEEQVCKTPKATAVVYEDESLSYEELNIRVNQVAHRLRKLGVGPDDFVAVLSDRSIECIVGICAIIKAGGAYVPIDPLNPAERIEYLLNDCNPKAVLTYRTSVNTSRHIVDLEDESLLNESIQNPERVNSVKDLAYCLYTSGTTGNPKGVMIQEQSVVNLVKTCDFVKLDGNTRMMQAGQLAFDASTLEIWGTLLNGGCMYLICRDTILDPVSFGEYLHRNRINMQFLTAALFNQCVSYDPKILDGFECLSVGGESLSVEHVNLLKKSAPQVMLSNGYGPTETTTIALWYKIHTEMNRQVPIGIPVANVQAYVMQDGQLCGIGVPGELCIAGDGVGRGYLNRPELTAEKFVDNPFGEGNMYRTGDLARWLPDGNVEFLGRIDTQVKIRGFRIELGEIESQLRKVSCIKDCTVVTREDSDGEIVMNAYVVGDDKIDLEAVKDELRVILPEYMVPAYMMQLDAIPMTKNGKVDKRGLPEITTGTKKNYIAPRNKKEETICSIFCELLSLERVSIDDSFFLLGGHSLRAAWLINRMEEKLGSRLKVSDVFHNPTPELLAGFVKENTVYESIPKAGEKEYYPMSSAQKRMFLACQLDSQGLSYNIVHNLCIKGEVSSEKMHAALQQLVDRHEILRTRFLLVDGEPMQQILSHAEVDFKTVAVSDADENELATELNEPFDLGNAPLFRAVLKKQKGSNLLILNIHHIITDGLSEEIISSELAALYNDEPLDMIVHQYKDYSEWMQTKNLEKQKQYWCDLFKDEIPVLDLPLDFVRPKTQSYRGGYLSTEIKGDLVKRLHLVASKNGVTEYMVFLSAVMILLGKYSRQKDIVVGTPISGRTHPDTEKMLGMFVNTLAMRGYPDGSKSYKEFLKEIREHCLKAYENQEYPFDELVDTINVQRDMSRNPLFDVMLVVQNNEQTGCNFHGAVVNSYYSEGNSAKFDLTFTLESHEERYHFGLEYCSDLFCEETAHLIQEHFVTVLDEITKKSERCISEIQMITEKERSLILDVFNATDAEYEKEKTVIDLFEEQVVRVPDHTAVICEKNQLSFEELNSRANRLAENLLALGVVIGDYIAVVAEKSAELIVSIIGIMKAGGVYVPIDPSSPQERINYILGDCKPKAVITYHACVETHIMIIDMTEEADIFDNENNPKRISGPGDLAYCIYTSGTTGNPKGVMVEHRNLMNYISYAKEHYVASKSPMQVPLFSNIAFDLTITSTFLGLITGGITRIYPDGTEYDIQSILENEVMTFVKLTPVHLKMMGRLKHLHSSSLEHMVLGGEALMCETAKKAQCAFGKGLLIHNEYGPTEATVGCCDYIFDEEEDHGTAVSIGKPINNTRIYIMNGMELCGIGVPGELCIAGDGVARGYLNQLELTAEKFISDPYKGGRLYKSGDLARWLPNGRLEYLGRIDEQVKIRGFRVEPEEIAGCLQRIDGIKDCAVIVRADQNGEKAIYAYLVGESKIDLEDVRRRLSNMLPEYMVPSYMLQLEKLPVTRNGKIDKRALPEISIGAAREYLAPRNKTEEIICSIFGEILGIDCVSVRDRFFELGGHSLRAAWLVNRIEEKTGNRITVGDVFSYQTPEELAELLKDGSEYEAIPYATVKEYYPMSSAQKRIYLVCQMDCSGISYNMPQCLYLPGDVSLEKMRNALNALIKRHEVLRTEFLMIDGEPMQRVLSYASVELAYDEDTETPENVLVSEFDQPFDLSKAPLLRAKLVKRNDGTLLLIDIHHIISDGISEEIFVEELAALYNGQELAPILQQYKDYSEWMLKKDFERQREYWRSQFEDDIPVLDMPLDYRRPQEQSFCGAMLYKQIDSEIAEKIRLLAASNGATEYMVLLSGVFILLSKYSRQDDIVVGSVINGRTHPDIEKMLGMFVNTLALRGKPSGNKFYSEFLQELRDNCLKAYENQDYPFEELVELVNAKRDMSHNPLFDVIMTLQNNEQSVYSFDGIKAQKRVSENDVAKFDLAFAFEICNGGYMFGLQYCTELYTRDSIMHMQEHYVSILRQIIENADIRLSELQAITADEKSLILGKFNDTARDYPKERTLTELFEEQVCKTPDADAVVYEDESLSYAEFNIFVNRVAHRLRRLGVMPDDFVIVLSDRSIECIAGICAIIKAGGAYVPVDPSNPADRIEYFISDCRPKAILTYRTSISTNLPVIDLENPGLLNESPLNPDCINSVNDLAYCIYTSGTTGNPKGVLIQENNVINVVKNCDYVKLDENTRMIQAGQLAFDASTLEIWGTLLNGGCMFLIKKETMLEPEAFCEYIHHNRINNQFLTTALFNQSVSYNPQTFEGLECLAFGGESASENHINTLWKSIPELRLSNVYGPTETTTIALWYNIRTEMNKRTPVGIPVANVQIYVLQDGHLCGIGVPGELCIAGDGVARGYLNRPELTAEKFIDNPFGKGKLYRTGDLARWLPDGNIEFLGRIDTQVKIRGFRIELGEIESQLRKVGSIKDCTVITREDSDGEIVINAYVVGNEKLDLEAVREELRLSLPEYMVPAYMMQLDAIPMTKNGKIDKSALPEIVGGTRKEYTAPRNEKENEICNIFCKIFGVEYVSVKDDFFELGGHSLKCVQLVNALQRRITIKDVFELRTVEKIAAYINESSMSENMVPRIEKAEDKDYYPMSEAQKRLYVFEQLDETKLSYNVPFCFRVEGEIDKQRANAAIKKLVERNESLRTSLCMVDGEFRQIVHNRVEIELEYQTIEVGEIKKEYDRFIRPFDLTKAPLFRAELAKDIAGGCWLLLDFHHSIVDGFSVNLLLREFERIYNGEQLEELSFQYRDYSAWFAKRDMGLQKEFWMKIFDNELADNELPMDYKRLENVKHKAAIIEQRLDWLKTEKVEQFCRKNGITQNMFFISVLSLLLSRYYGSEDVVIGIPASCRTHADTENIVGMLVNTLPVRMAPAGEKRFADYIDEVRHIIMDALNNQEYPFNTIVEELHAERAQGRNPLFDVFFNYYDSTLVNSICTKDFQAEPCEIESGNGKFDLVFDVILKDGYYSLNVTYKTGLYSNRTAEQLLKHYEKLIEWALKNEEKPIKLAEMLSKEEEKQVFESFQTKKIYDETETFPDMLRTCTLVVGEKTALVCRDQEMSYRELERKSKAVAAALLKSGVEKEEVVGVMAVPGFGMFVGAIGTMMAGAAYMPIDSQYPKERIEYMIQKSRCRLVLYDEVLMPDFGQDIQAITIESAMQNDECDLPEIKPDSLAYVIFTSGSTGQPKGVMIEHRSLANMIRWNNEYYNLSEHDKTTKYAGFGFDASVHEMYPPLAAGAQIHIIPEEMRMDIQGICRYIDSKGINIGFFPTPVCELLSKEKCHTLEKVITGGDKLKSFSEDYVIYNNYGPTECTVLTTAYCVDRVYDNIPIGKPITNTEVYIVNKTGQLQPIGLIGEIWISGAGLARGYINDESRTRENFIPNPFRRGERVYKTGDLGRWLPDGNIEYQGRNDDQVKVRGNRVELGEIESVSASRCGIINCAAIVDKSTGTERIALFYLAKEKINQTEAKRILQKYLPKYMIPDIWVRLDSFPLSSNGKVNKKKLKVETQRAVPSISRKATECEQIIGDIWKGILGTDSIGLDENFFEAGGTSLSLVAMFSKLCEKFPDTLQIADVFANPTIEMMAKHIQKRRGNQKRYILPGMEFGSTCFGDTKTLGYHYTVTSCAPIDFADKFSAAVLFALSKITKNNSACIGVRQANGRYRTAECDMNGIKTLEEVVSKMQMSENDWDCLTAVRRPAAGRCTCGIYVSLYEAVPKKEQEHIDKLFDIWILADVKQDGIYISLKKNNREIQSDIAKQIMKLIVSIVNILTDK